MLKAITPEKIIGYFFQLDAAGKKSFLSLLQEYIKENKEHALPQSLAEYNLEIEKADADIEAGNFILHEDVLKYFSKK
jgi:hypothetical protein